MPDRHPNATKPSFKLEHDLHAHIRFGCAELPELPFYDCSLFPSHGGRQTEYQLLAPELPGGLPNTRDDDRVCYFAYCARGTSLIPAPFPWP